MKEITQTTKSKNKHEGGTGGETGGWGGWIRTSDLMILLGGWGGIRLSSFYDSTRGKGTDHWVVHPCASSIPESFEIELSVQNSAISHNYNRVTHLRMSLVNYRKFYDNSNFERPILLEFTLCDLS